MANIYHFSLIKTQVCLRAISWHFNFFFFSVVSDSTNNHIL